MALDGTYAGLKASIAAWLDDDSLTAVIPDFITLAEARFNDRLRLSAMETQLTVVPGTASLTSEMELIDPDTGTPLTDPDTGAVLTGDVTEIVPVSTIPLPSNFLEMRRVVVNVSPQRPISLIAPDWATISYSGLSGTAWGYTIIGSTLAAFPQASDTMTLVYYAKIPALSDTNTTNWLLTDRPQIYLYGALLEAAPYLLDDTRATVWQTYLETAIDNAEQADRRRRWSNAVMRLPGPVV